MSTPRKSIKSKIAHTPGPWDWQVGDECISAEGGKTFIAWLPSSASARKSRVVRADARLIALAPDMLEVVKAVERYGVQHLNAKCREIIAKAEGK